MDRATPEPQPVPPHLMGTRVVVRYRHDADEQVVEGVIERADGGYVVTDGHRVVPIVETTVVAVRAADEDRDA